MDPLSVNPSSVAAKLQMELIDLQANEHLKQQHLSHELRVLSWFLSSWHISSPT